jgi:glycolate oxidase FAD binding subunit
MTVRPESAEALQDAIRRHGSLLVRGAGTKSPPGDGVVVSLQAMAGIREYSAEECVITALPGTPLADLDRTLAAHGQYLPFDPPLASAGATIGGTVAAGVSGPLRYRYGGVRDFVIGARVVDGEARQIRSGGKVVKNAAGFLLHHAMVGSQGRFGVLAEITLKVFPQPEARATVSVQRGAVKAAAEAVRALESMRIDLEALDFDGDGTVWIRLAGRAAALDGRVARVIAAVGGDEVPRADEEAIWAGAREFAWAPGSASIVRIPMSASTAPGSPALLASTPAMSNGSAGLRVRYSCGGRLAFVATDDVPSLAAKLATAKSRGVILRGPDAGRTIGHIEPNVFEERVRHVLDPRNRFRAASDPR